MMRQTTFAYFVRRRMTLSQPHRELCQVHVKRSLARLQKLLRHASLDRDIQLVVGLLSRGEEHGGSHEQRPEGQGHREVSEDAHRHRRVTIRLAA